MDESISTNHMPQRLSSVDQDKRGEHIVTKRQNFVDCIIMWDEILKFGGQMGYFSTNKERRSPALIVCLNLCLRTRVLKSPTLVSYLNSSIRW